MSKRRNYSEKAVLTALGAISCGMGIREASRAYGVPSTTLHNEVTLKAPVECKNGGKTFLSVEEENGLVEWALYCQRKGRPVTKNLLLDSVLILVKNQKKKTPFTNDRPGRDWYNAFLRRHPILCERISQNLTPCRAAVTQEALNGWFSYVENYLKEEGLDNIGPDRQFNCDEAAFLFSPKTGKVLAKKGIKIELFFNKNYKEFCHTFTIIMVVLIL